MGSPSALRITTRSTEVPDTEELDRITTQVSAGR
jgi:hypothetical protein